MPFKQATRKGTFVLIGLTGHSGSGKTYSALRLARGLVGANGRIGALDTENGRMSHYSDLTPFDVDELHAPFTPARYVEKIMEARAAKFDCLIIDSFSHEWEGTGGVIEMAEGGRAASGKELSGLQKWNKPKAEHKKLVNAVLQSPMHIIICMRGKDKLVQMKDEKGKDVIVNTGVVPIQDARFLFEMTVSLIMQEGKQTPKIQKCPEALRHLFPENQFITEAAGAGVAAWVGTGIPLDTALEDAKIAARDVAEAGMNALKAHWTSLGGTMQQKLGGETFLNELKSIAKAADEDAAGRGEL